jgi:hypothetical protein
MTLGSQAAKRSWVALLYFYAAALVGLGFVVVGTTLALFGAKNALFPSLGVSSYSYEYSSPDPLGLTEQTEQQRQAARDRAIDERRSSGLDDMLSGFIIVGVGTPVLIWHLKRGRALSAGDAQATQPPPSGS